MRIEGFGLGFVFIYVFCFSGLALINYKLS